MDLTRPQGPLPLGARDPGDPSDAQPTRRAAGAALFAAGYAAFQRPVNAAAITTDDRGLVIDEVRFAGAGDYRLPAYLARPAARGRFPAVIVVNEIFGVHAYIKDVCRRLAKTGYVAIAPDYFDRLGDPATLTDFAQIRPIVAATGMAQVLADTQGAADFLARRRWVAPARIGLTGFCWGGAVAWLAAARVRRVRAAVAWYGRLGAPSEGAGALSALQAARELKAPVLGLYAENDQGIPLGDVEAMRAALKAARDPTGSTIIVYPGVQHGFHADYRPQYDDGAARDGWARMLAWFRQHGV